MDPLKSRLHLGVLGKPHLSIHNFKTYRYGKLDPLSEYF